jgi:hypothetical protein
MIRKTHHPKVKRTKKRKKHQSIIYPPSLNLIEYTINSCKSCSLFFQSQQLHDDCDTYFINNNPHSRSLLQKIHNYCTSFVEEIVNKMSGESSGKDNNQEHVSQENKITTIIENTINSTNERSITENHVNFKSIDALAGKLTIKKDKMEQHTSNTSTKDKKQQIKKDTHLLKKETTASKQSASQSTNNQKRNTKPSKFMQSPY